MDVGIGLLPGLPERCNGPCCAFIKVFSLANFIELGVKAWKEFGETAFNSYSYCIPIRTLDYILAHV